MTNAEWKEYKLGEIYEVHNGLSKGREFFGSGYPFISFSTVFNKWFIPEIITDFAQTTESEQESYSIKAGDILVTRTSETADELGMSCVALRDIPNATYNGFCKRMRQYNKDVDVDSKYVGYYMRNPEFRKKFQAFAGSMSTRASLTNDALLGLTIKLPPLAEQQRIAKILSTLDDKIELNNAINRNLEEQAQAIFKNWFIDFEPFGGKMPEDWKETRIGDLPIYVTDYVSNGSFASLKENVTLLQNDGFAYFVRNTDLKVSSFNTFVDEHSYNFLEKSKLFGGEIIISNVGDVGSVFLCPKLNKPMTLGNNIIMLRCLKDFQKYFFYMWFKWFDGQISIKNVTGGSVLQKFNKTDFKNIKIHMPLDESLERFNASISPFINKIEENAKENQRIARVRDELLPKLMSENS
jgi:type I restriction enzyme S subunit